MAISCQVELGLDEFQVSERLVKAGDERFRDLKCVHLLFECFQPKSVCFAFFVPIVQLGQDRFNLLVLQGVECDRFVHRVGSHFVSLGIVELLICQLVQIFHQSDVSNVDETDLVE